MTSDTARPQSHCWNPAVEILGGSGLLFWTLVAVSLCAVSGPALLQCVRYGAWMRVGERQFIPDFFQDYASARNYYNGLDVYSDHDATARLYLDPAIELDPGHESFKVNAHPPTSILLSLPLTALDFPSAHFAWNLFSLLLLASSLATLVRQLDIPWSMRSFAPAASLILLSNALWDNLLNGQYALVLLYLLVVVWAADRSNRPMMAGVALGLATAIKIFPGFLFVYFLIRKRWAVLCSGVGALIVMSGLTASVFGMQVYRQYLVEAYPRFAWFKSSWPNASVAGYWYRLLDTAPSVQRVYYQTRPLIYSPKAALGATLLSDLTLTVVLVGVARRARTRGDTDVAFALTVVMMLLLSPITWPNHLTLLLLPFAITWRNLNPGDWRRWLFLGVVALCLFVSPNNMIQHVLRREETAAPLHSLTLFPLQCYAMLVYVAAFFPVLPARLLRLPRVIGAAARPDREIRGSGARCSVKE
jgi:hypothetical protein